MKLFIKKIEFCIFRLLNNNLLLYNMEEFIQNFLESDNYKYVKIENHEIINHIYNLYKYGVDGRDTFKMEDSIIDLYYGVYYRTKKDYKQMKKYFDMAIEKGNTSAMNNLGVHYKRIEKDYKQMKKYYLMAIEKGHSHAMYNMAIYYDEIEKDYDQMKKYYLMAIEKGDSDAMNNLGFYYGTIEKDYDQMKKYYFMAIEKGNSLAKKNLEKYYQKNNNTMGLLQLYIKINDIDKLLKILINYLNQNTMNEEINLILLKYFDNIDVSKLPVIFRILKQSLNTQVDLLEAHFKYTENGLGFNEAREDFYQQVFLSNNIQ